MAAVPTSPHHRVWPGAHAPGLSAPRPRPHPRLVRPGLLLWLVGAMHLAPALAQPASAPLALEQAVRIASERSRLVDAAKAQALAARELVVVASQTPDPVLKIGINNLPVDGRDAFSLSRDFMTMRSVGVMQEFTREDKRKARGERAEREVALADLAQRQAVADAQREAAAAWLECSFQESMRLIALRQHEQAQTQAQAAEALYRSGKVPQADVFAARGEAEMLHDRLDRLERQISVARARFARWVGDAAQAPLAARPAFERPAWLRSASAAPGPSAPRSSAPAPSTQELAAQLQQHLAQNPQQHLALAAPRAQEAAAEADAKLALANRQADWSAELMFSQRGAAFSNMVSINFSLPLPWDRAKRQDRELSAKRALVEQARAKREDAQRAYEAELQAMLHEWASHELRLKRHDEVLLPLATQRSEAALTAYRSGSGSLSAVLEARRQALELHLDRLGIERDIARLWAQLAFVSPPEAAEAGTAVAVGTTPATAAAATAARAPGSRP